MQFIFFPLVSFEALPENKMLWENLLGHESDF